MGFLRLERGGLLVGSLDVLGIFHGARREVLTIFLECLGGRGKGEGSVKALGWVDCSWLTDLLLSWGKFKDFTNSP